jgi:hypothetical protein
MAPSNLSQVFVANASDGSPVLTGTTFLATAASGNAANSKVGIWDVYKSTPTYSTALLSTATATSGVITSTLKTVQFTQTMLSGNMIATPLIDTKDIKRIAFTKYKAAAPYKIVADLSPSGTDSFADSANGDQPIMMRFAIRTAPTSYASFANPNDTALDISSDTTKYVAPIQGNFSAGRKIYSIEIPELGADGHNNDEDTFVTVAVIAINSHPILKKILFASGSTDNLTIEARHEGVVFDFTLQYSDGTAIGETQTITGNSGVGNYYQVLSDEKSHRSKYGNFNRMYFPMDFPTFAQAGTTYDVIDISYAHDHPASTGIARAGELNNVRIYVPSALTGATNVDTTFGFGNDVMGVTGTPVAAGLITEYLF